jgi:hypothetical protein
MPSVASNAYIEPNAVERICHRPNEMANPLLDLQQLAQENGCLRVIIAELLLKNQNLRWALMGEGRGPQSGEEAWPGIPLSKFAGTPLRKNSRTAGIP